MTTHIETHDVDPVAAMRLALDIESSVHDATYLVLARTTGRPLLTADRRLADRADLAGVEAIGM